MATLMTWTVEVTVHIGSPAADPDLGDRLLGELTVIVPAGDSAIAQDTLAGTVSAVLSVSNMDDPDGALTAGRKAVHLALGRLGLAGEEVGLCVAALDLDLTTAR